MRILHVIPSVSLVRGGPSHAVLDMVWQLRQQGVDAAIVTTNDDGDRLMAVELNQWLDYPVNGHDRHQTVPVQFFSRFSPAMSGLREFTFSWPLTRWLWQHIRDYDLLHIHAIFSYSTPLAAYLARAAQIPYIIRPLGSLAHWSLQQGAQKKRLYLNLISGALGQANALHFTAPSEQQEATALGLVQAGFILPHGITLPKPIADAQRRLRERLHLPLDEPIILFLSRLHAKKGLDYLIPALSQLRQHRFTFLLAGSGSPAYTAEVEALLTRYDLSDRTRLWGFTAGEEKNLLLQGADLFTLTSHSENFGIAVLEAMAVGLPVIVTPGVALATVVAEQQLGAVPDLEITAIAAAIANYLIHQEHRTATGDRAQQFVAEHYTWPQIAVQLGQIYRSLIYSNSLSPIPDSHYEHHL
jgi:glycosyltransferase involved in cell wall biosynthesis